jgi:hypothetical protein
LRAAVVSSASLQRRSGISGALVFISTVIHAVVAWKCVARVRRFVRLRRRGDLVTKELSQRTLRYSLAFLACFWVWLTYLLKTHRYRRRLVYAIGRRLRFVDCYRAAFRRVCRQSRS